MSQHRLCKFGSAKFAGPANIFCASHLKFSDAVMLFSLQMQPTLSHVPQRLLARNFGQTARPKASPKCLQDSKLRPAFVTQMLEGFGPRPHMAFHRFGTATRMLSPTYWHVQTYFRPSTGGIQKHGALLPHSWIQEAPLKGLEGGDFGIYIGKNTIAPNGRQASKAPPRPPPVVWCAVLWWWVLGLIPFLPPCGVVVVLGLGFRVCTRTPPVGGGVV